MTKPSEWDREAVWREGCKAGAEYINERCILLPTTVAEASSLPFPADPVERVSDEKLEQFTTPVFNNTAMQLMALELIERRARDKEQKG